MTYEVDHSQPLMTYEVTPSIGAELHHSEWYPQGQSTVLICEAIGFEATTWDFVFGDGHSLTGIDKGGVYHRYPGPGSYDTTCTAHGEGISETAYLQVVIEG